MNVYQNIFKTRSRPSQLKIFLLKKNTPFSSLVFFLFIMRLPRNSILWYASVIPSLLKEFRPVSAQTILCKSSPSQMLWWGCFEIPTPKTLENMQKNVFSAVLIPDWKFLCRYFTGSAQKRKDILRFRNFPEVFKNVCLFTLCYKPAKQNSHFNHHESEC